MLQEENLILALVIMNKIHKRKLFNNSLKKLKKKIKKKLVMDIKNQSLMEWEMMLNMLKFQIHLEEEVISHFIDYLLLINENM